MSVSSIGTLLRSEPFHKSPDALKDSARFEVARRISWQLACLWRWVTLSKRICWLELRSVVPHMRIARAAIAEGGVDLGQLFEQSTEHAGLTLNIQTQRCIQDAEWFSTNFPFCTAADLHFFLLGREMRGTAFSCDSPHKIEKAEPIPAL